MQLQGIPELIEKVLLSTKHSLFYPKSGLLNGHNSVNFDGHFYLKVAKTSLFSNRTVEEFSLGCSISKLSNLWTEHSQKSSKWIIKFCPSICLRSWSSRVNFLSFSQLGFSCYEPKTTMVISALKQALENSHFLSWKGQPGVPLKRLVEVEQELYTNEYYLIIELQQLRNWKKLTKQKKNSDRAEVSIIGKLNHMNLIEMQGCCAEGKHRLLVYKCMEHWILSRKFVFKCTCLGKAVWHFCRQRNCFAF